MLSSTLSRAVAELAIAKALKEKQVKVVREQVGAGEYLIEALVRLKGTLKVGDDTTATRPQALCPWTALVVALSKLNPATADAVLDEVVQAYREGRKIETEDVKKQVAAKAALALEETRDVRKGAVAYAGDVDLADCKVRLALK